MLIILTETPRLDSSANWRICICLASSSSSRNGLPKASASSSELKNSSPSSSYSSPLPSMRTGK
ncbi:ORF1074 [White spot syndrome virus]|uniref:ORF1074 n=1 Tax=White spot syndrome virus TaxID=342409 RepID=A0A2D3I713_9VIRU|nr:ORF1074 [White spot syndrome virus]